jgi:hypothetical protein
MMPSLTPGETGLATATPRNAGPPAVRPDWLHFSPRVRKGMKLRLSKTVPEQLSAAYYNIHRAQEHIDADGEDVPVPAHLQALRKDSTYSGEDGSIVDSLDPLAKRKQTFAAETTHFLMKQNNALRTIKSRPVVSAKSGMPTLAQLGWVEPVVGFHAMETASASSASKVISSSTSSATSSTSSSSVMTVFSHRA